jgi:hypothetical protein
VVAEVVDLDGAGVGLAEAEVASRIAQVGNLDQLGWQLGIRPFA